MKDLPVTWKDWKLNPEKVRICVCSHKPKVP